MSYLTNAINDYQRLDRDLRKYLTAIVEDIKLIGTLNSTYDEYYSDWEDLDISDVEDAKNKFSYHGFLYHSYSVSKDGKTLEIILMEDRYREPEYKSLEIPFSVFEDENGWVTWAKNKLKSQLDVIKGRAERLKIKEAKDKEIQKQQDYERYLKLKAEFEGQ